MQNFMNFPFDFILGDDNDGGKKFEITCQKKLHWNNSLDIFFLKAKYSDTETHKSPTVFIHFHIFSSSQIYSS